MTQTVSKIVSTINFGIQIWNQGKNFDWRIQQSCAPRSVPLDQPSLKDTKGASAVKLEAPGRNI